MHKYSRKISKVLVGNRGEIALRIMRTARRMGIRTIAVYSDADEKSLHTLFSDEAHRIGEPSPLRSYLCMEKIIEVAKRAKADAIHPGYGFLSENAEFAGVCAENGITFIGPPSQAIRDMGMKNTAKQIMINANVPVICGYNGVDQNAELLLEESKNIGFPVMIKAVCGGGGKGMRVSWSPDDFIGQLDSARSEAQKAFGNSDMIVEKFVEKPRHVEVQIFGDMHGNYVYLWERDCSIQRRHQKIIEEAPAPGLSLETRHKLGKAAVEAARAVNYVGAGTVEFIMDPRDGQFYFMEMNTRLQVEHGITEAITGVDLVEWQFRVAQGEKLPLSQEQIPLQGHAIEARIYAEDSNSFMPTPGVLEHLEFPTTGSAADDVFCRIDSGVREGDEVSVHYDPMIAKVIAAGENREQAIRLLDSALARTHIGGLCNNVQFLRDCLQHEKFQNGVLYTDFIEDHREELLRTKECDEEAVVEGAMSKLLMKSFDCLTASSSSSSVAFSSSSPFLSQPLFFRVNHTAKINVKLDDHQIVEVSVLKEGGQYELRGKKVRVGGMKTGLTEHTSRPMLRFWIELEGRRWHCKTVALSHGIKVFGSQQREWSAEISEVEGEEEDIALLSGEGNILSPMPGLIEKMFVKEGDFARKSQPLVALNAMKMEYVVKAPYDCHITSVECSIGQNVPKDSILMRLSRDEGNKQQQLENDN